MASDSDSQVAELQVSAAILNQLTTLVTPTIVALALP